MNEMFDVTPCMLRKRPEMAADGFKVGDKVAGKVLHAKYSRYMQKVAEANPELVEKTGREGRTFHASHVYRTNRHHLPVIG